MMVNSQVNPFTCLFQALLNSWSKDLSSGLSPRTKNLELLLTLWRNWSDLNSLASFPNLATCVDQYCHFLPTSPLPQTQHTSWLHFCTDQFKAPMCSWASSPVNPLASDKRKKSARNEIGHTQNPTFTKRLMHLPPCWEWMKEMNIFWISKQLHKSFYWSSILRIKKPRLRRAKWLSLYVTALGLWILHCKFCASWTLKGCHSLIFLLAFWPPGRRQANLLWINGCYIF